MKYRSIFPDENYYAPHLAEILITAIIHQIDNLLLDPSLTLEPVGTVVFIDTFWPTDNIPVRNEDLKELLIELINKVDSTSRGAIGNLSIPNREQAKQIMRGVINLPPERNQDPHEKKALRA